LYEVSGADEEVTSFRRGFLLSVQPLARSGPVQVPVNEESEMDQAISDE
jgi:hypothetical protein